jgi:hypothetical protein
MGSAWPKTTKLLSLFLCETCEKKKRRRSGRRKRRRRRMEATAPP